MAVYDPVNKGANNDWYKNLGVDFSTPVVPVYYKYFKQKDTLKSIPKIIEAKVKLQDQEVYNEIVEKAEEEKSNLEESKDIILPVYNKDYIDTPELEEGEEESEESDG
jgi:hypothetical protein